MHEVVFGKPARRQVSDPALVFFRIFSYIAVNGRGKRMPASMSMWTIAAVESIALSAGASCFARKWASFGTASRSAFGGEHAGNTRKIVGNAHVNPSWLHVEHSANFVRCIVAEFEHQDAAFAQERAGLFDEARVDLDARGA